MVEVQEPESQSRYQPQSQPQTQPPTPTTTTYDASAPLQKTNSIISLPSLSQVTTNSPRHYRALIQPPQDGDSSLVPQSHGKRNKTCTFPSNQSVNRSIDQFIFHPLNKSLTLIPPPPLLLLLLLSPAAFAAPTPRHCLRSLFSIKRAAVASWSSSNSLRTPAAVVEAGCLGAIEERLESFSKPRGSDAS